MGTQSFVDAYEKLIRDHNNKVMNTPVKSQKIIKQADDEKKEDQEQEEDLNLGDEEQEDEDQNVEDEKEDIEGDQEQEEQNFDLDMDDLDDEPQSQGNPEELNPQNQVAFNFPDALLTEFINTVNQFTRLCAEVVQNKSVTQDKSKQLDKLVGKIKNLLQAAQKSV